MSLNVLDPYSTVVETHHSGGHSTVETRLDDKGNKVIIKTYNIGTAAFYNPAMAARHPGANTLIERINKALAIRQQHKDIPNERLILPTRLDDSRVVYPFIEGQTVDEICNAKLEIAHRIKTARQVVLGGMSVLEILIQRGLAHRDVKPRNLIMRKDGGIGLLDIDFLTEVDNSKSRFFGTVDYAAPEQALGFTSATMDVTSLALSATELLDVWTQYNLFGELRDLVADKLYQRAIGVNVQDPSLRKKILNLDRFPEEVRKEVHGLLCFLLGALNNFPYMRPQTEEDARQLLEMTPNISMI